MKLLTRAERGRLILESNIVDDLYPIDESNGRDIITDILHHMKESGKDVDAELHQALNNFHEELIEEALGEAFIG